MEQLTNPITLLVKAPNQKITDQTVECFLEWTVKRLKSHLAAVYPSQPDEKHQRIIYSGKLLQDNVTLKEVLRIIDDNRLHTVHLVCFEVDEKTNLPKTTTTSVDSSSSNQPSKRTSSPSNSTPNSSANSRRPSFTESTTSDGVRQRNIHRSDSSQNIFNYSNPYMQQSYGMSGGGSPQSYTPQQMQWMQQMYAQQMAAYYMQYSNSGMPGVVSPWSQLPLGGNIPQNFQQVPLANQNLPAQQPAAEIANQNLAREAPLAPNALQNNVRPAQNAPMNAGVGPAIDEDDDDGVHRDWLDWIYTFCRFGVLISVVYFYSSMNRFLLVGGVMMLVYLYEQGFFQLRRRQAPRAREEAQPNPVPAPAPEAGNNEGGGDAREPHLTDEEVDNTDSGPADAPEAPGTPGNEPQPEEVPRPGIIGTTWIFLSTFFTSLIPQGPQNLAA